MSRKERVTFTAEQKLEYAKLMVNEGYSNKQIRDISGAGPAVETTVFRRNGGGKHHKGKKH